MINSAELSTDPNDLCVSLEILAKNQTNEYVDDDTSRVIFAAIKYIHLAEKQAVQYFQAKAMWEQERKVVLAQELEIKQLKLQLQHSRASLVDSEE